MADLRAFMAENVAPEENVKYIASRKFVDCEGNPIEWELKAISTDEDQAIRKSCSKRVPAPGKLGKRGQFIQETDTNLYLGKLAAACTVYPNLKDKELQDSYGVMGEDALLKKLLNKTGEYADYLVKVQEVNGFDVFMEDLVDEAKN